METMMPTSMPTKIVASLAKIMGEVGSVKKDGENKFHGYKYATAADIQHKLQPLLAREGLVIVQNELSSELWGDGAVLTVTYEFGLFHKDGDAWPDRPRYTGMAAARNSKGGFDDKSINKCHTAARKYFLLGLFQIPTGDYDDADEQEDQPVQKQAIAPRKEPPPAPLPSTHPDTGDYAPHVIPYANDPIAWGSVYVASIKTSAMLTDVAEWRHHNKPTLDDIKKSAPKVYQRIDAAEKACMNTLTATAEAAE